MKSSDFLRPPTSSPAVAAPAATGVRQAQSARRTTVDSPLARRLAESLVRRLTRTSTGLCTKQTLVDASLRLGLRNVARIVDAGVQLKVDAVDHPYKSAYYPSSKVIHIGIQRLNVDTVVHELAHALDAALGRREGTAGGPQLRSDGDARLLDLYDGYAARASTASLRDRLCRGAVWSSYAATNVHEYFAEGAMHYANPRRQGQLQRSDPGLWSYVRDTLDGDFNALQPTPRTPGGGSPAAAPRTLPTGPREEK